jgi:hypothetical protein
MEELMEWVSIQEASRRLNVSQDIIRRYAREGRLQAKREDAAHGGKTWVVELPEGEWEDDFKHHIHGIAQQLTPWWWPTPEKAGEVHYVDGLGIEEIEALFLCGLMTDNIFAAVGHDPSLRCPECLEEVKKRGLPLETRE